LATIIPTATGRYATEIVVKAGKPAAFSSSGVVLVR
jgi:hypothetical protein